MFLNSDMRPTLKALVTIKLYMYIQWKYAHWYLSSDANDIGSKLAYFSCHIFQLKDNLKYLGQCFQAFGLRLYDDFKVQNKWSQKW
jgi:hypothetical protein